MSTDPPKKFKSRRANKTRRLPSEVLRGLYGELVRKGHDRWFFTALETEGIGYNKIVEQLGQWGITATPDSVYHTLKFKRGEWEFRQAVRESVERQLSGTGRQVTLEMLDRRLMTLATAGAMKPQELINARKLLIDEETLEVRKMEATRRLYDSQMRAATFAAELLRDEARQAELRALATDRTLSGEDYVEAVRRKVYGSDAIAKPSGMPVWNDRCRDSIEFGSDDVAIQAVNGNGAGESLSQEH